MFYKSVAVINKKYISPLAPKIAKLQYFTDKFTEVEPTMASLGYYIYVFTSLDEAVVWSKNVMIYHSHMEIWSVEGVNEKTPKPPVPPRILFLSNDILETIKAFNANGIQMPPFTVAFEKIILKERVSSDYK